MPETEPVTTPGNPQDQWSEDKVFANAFRYASIGMALVAPDGTWLKVNKSLCSMLGYSSQELLSKTFQDITHPDDLDEDLVYVNRMLSGAIDTYQMEKRYYHKGGHIVDVLLSVSLVRESGGAPRFFISQIQDITRRKRVERELLLVSREDPLTRVANRRFFMEHATREMTRGDRFHEPQALMMIDIDHFKGINDTYGHDAGDEVLRGMAAACREALREVDVFGRIGGEEFAALLLNTDADIARMIAERVRQSIAGLRVGSAREDIRFTVSIGVVAFLGGARNLEERLKTADNALYRAKESGRNRVELVEENPEPARLSPEHLRATFVRFHWKQEFESGNQLIDSQHMHLFSLANDLLSAVMTGLPDSLVEAAAVNLVKHVERHFHDEGEIISGAGYGEAKAHMAIHGQLTREMHTLLNLFRERKAAVGDLFTFLAHTVVAEHLLIEDRKFFSHLRGS